MIGLKGYFKIEPYNNYNPYTIRKKIVLSKQSLFIETNIIIFLYIYRHYTMRKKIVDSQRATILSINILIFFYIFKEPYFFLSKYKILILLVSILIGYSSLIFLQKIKIKLSLNFFKEIIKIFLISGTIYYFPIICIQIFLVFFKN